MTSAPFAVMCAPNGARKSRQDHPALPITAAELADCAESVAEAGAALIHVHVRDERDRHTLDAGRYRDAVAAIRSRVGDSLIIQLTTEACGIYSPSEQMAVVRELRPEAVSVALREICPDAAAEPVAADFYRFMADSGIFAQHILYSAEEVERFAALHDAGVTGGTTAFVLFVLGRYSTGLTGDVTDLDSFVRALPDGALWSVCCFGATEHQAVARAARLGGHARVGFENNLLLADGSPAADNAALVQCAVAAGRAAGRAPATAGDLRGMVR